MQCSLSPSNDCTLKDLADVRNAFVISKCRGNIRLGEKHQIMSVNQLDWWLKGGIWRDGQARGRSLAQHAEILQHQSKLVIASAAKQSRAVCAALDCFVGFASSQ